MDSIKKNTLITTLAITFFILTLYNLASVLAPFMLALILAYILEPITSIIEKKLKVPRSLASAITIGLLVALFILIVGALLPIVYMQLNQLNLYLLRHTSLLSFDSFSGALEWLEGIAPGSSENIKKSFAEVITNLLSFSNLLIGNVLRSSMTALSILGSTVIIPIITYYALRQWDTIITSTKGLIPPKHKPKCLNVISEIDITLSNWLRGQVSICALMAIIYSVLLVSMGLNAGLSLGILSGVLTFIPYVGAFVSSLICITTAALQFDYFYQVAMVSIAFLTVQVLEGTLLTPYIMGNQVGLHPVWVLLGLFVSGSVMGFAGIIFAVPLTAITAVAIRLIIENYKNSSVYK